MGRIFDVGESVRLTAAFTDHAGTALDVEAEEVTLTVQSPDGEVASPTVNAGSGTGEFYADVLADQEGEWEYRWYTPYIVEEGSFAIRERRVPAP